jgi:starvation-inducible outer membrane lipoprotein
MALLATTLLAACSKVPDGILSEKKMQGDCRDSLPERCYLTGEG